MPKTDTMLEIEIDGPNNQQHRFRPLQRNLRGRFDFGRVAEPMAKLQTNRFPQPIPGQRLSLDTASGEAAIIEPLHDAEHIRTRRTIEKHGSTIAPQQQPLGKVHIATFLFWMKSAVEAGLARVVRGTLPDVIEGEPQKSFLSAAAFNPNDRLAAALESIVAVNREILAQLKSR